LRGDRLNAFRLLNDSGRYLSLSGIVYLVSGDFVQLIVYH